MMRLELQAREALDARVDAALIARRAVADVPILIRAEALARAAARWQRDARLADVLVGTTGFSRPMIDAVLPLAADAFAASAIVALVERELGAEAIGKPPPAGPAMVLHVLASNVPALALPAIALGVLAGAVVLVKSGRDDPESAPAFVEALAAERPDLAATVIAAYWPGATAVLEDAALARADVTVLTGGDAALAALVPRARGRCVLHGPRTSIAAVGRGALADGPTVAARIAADAVLHEQRGCLSPQAAYVEEGGAMAPREFADVLLAALETMRERLPPARAGIEERAAVRVAWDAAEHEPGTLLRGAPGAGVILQAAAPGRPAIGGRTLRVHPIRELGMLPGLLPMGVIECVGLAGADATALATPLLARGVSRICPVGRMQRPTLSWPRGQRAPLGALLGHPAEPCLEIER